MPPSIITHVAFKTLMSAQIHAFMVACPVSPAASRAVRWDQLKAQIQDVARHYCSTFHAERTGQLRALRVFASHARDAYLADPTSQAALDQLRFTAPNLFIFFLGGRAIHYICEKHMQRKNHKGNVQAIR
ncbi:hypothetical protein ABBQ32_008115 [Trebouxia sp. C0010 RCD-2024]